MKKQFCIKILKDDKKIGWWKKGSSTYPPITEDLKRATKIEDQNIAMNAMLRLSELFRDYNFTVQKLKSVK